jgi:5-methylcytosine-specific restriction endonuclease McrA
VTRQTAWEAELERLALLFPTVPGTKRERPEGMTTLERAAATFLRYRVAAKLSSVRHRAKQYGVLDTLMLVEWTGVLNESRGVCFYCQEYVGLLYLGLDHVVPMGRGGVNTVNNIAAACGECNTKKHTRPLAAGAFALPPFETSSKKGGKK